LATFDNNPKAEPLSGIPLLIGSPGFKRWLDTYDGSRDVNGLVAIGGSRGSDRIRIFDHLISKGLQSDPLIDDRANVDASAHIGKGCQVLPGAIVSADAKIGRASIVNHKASVDHECLVGSGVHIAPGATLCGLVAVGDAAFIGSNATVPPRLTIGRGAIVGAGAVVTRDVPDYAVVVGNPARIIRIESPE